MSLITVVKSLLNLQKKMDIKSLPSQGFFYKDDFEIWIKRCDVDHIKDYENNYIKDNLGSIIHKVKKIVENNTIFSYGYTFNDIKSIDIIYLFLEIVKFTKNEKIKIPYVDENGLSKTINFEKKNFNYYKLDDYIKYYNKETKQFIIDNYMFSLPSIGVENGLTNFLISKANDKDATKYNEYFYDFTYFLGDKNNLKFNEIENLIQIFNFEIDEKEMLKINKIMDIFIPLQSYSLLKNNNIIEISSKIDLEKIWK